MPRHDMLSSVACASEHPCEAHETHLWALCCASSSGFRLKGTPVGTFTFKPILRLTTRQDMRSTRLENRGPRISIRKPPQLRQGGRGVLSRAAADTSRKNDYSASSNSVICMSIQPARNTCLQPLGSRPHANEQQSKKARWTARVVCHHSFLKSRQVVLAFLSRVQLSEWALVESHLLMLYHFTSFIRNIRHHSQTCIERHPRRNPCRRCPSTPFQTPRSLHVPSCR